MRIRVTRVAVAWVAALVWGVWLAQSTAAGEPDFVIVTPDEIQWRSVPSHDGLQVAFLAGNPAESGYYVMRVRFAAGAMSRPHSHDQDRYVTVIEGTWYAGTQAVFDPDATVALRAGSFMMHPAGAVHYDGAKAAPVIVEIRGLGPVATDYVAAPSATLLERVLRMVGG